jgi:sec-independent protein translocase protein TatA
MSLPFAWLTLSPMEMMILALVVLLLFGNRLPSVMRSLGRGVVEFKKGVQGVEDEVSDAASKRIEEPAAKKPDAAASQKQEEPVAKQASEQK